MKRKEMNYLKVGDNLDHLRRMEDKSVDLIYMDPPFFTQTTQTLISRESVTYSFDDSWITLEVYISFLRDRLIECHRILKDTGSIFVHCDKTASHYIRVLLDEVFGMNMFQSEIIWSYKRWSNSKKGLLNNHQTIYFYSKTKNFTFNTLYTDYSVTTNLDQILADRKRDEHNKSVYKLDGSGQVVMGKEKKGVPLSDVWEIPFLNPKAKERIGYPTQKPLLLLEQIIKIASQPGDVVLDPFCGSGTTLVAAKLLDRQYIGLDIKEEAINLSRERLEHMVKTESALLKKGKSAYQQKSPEEMSLLNLLQANVVQRNKGIDGFLKEYYDDKPVPVKIQKVEEDLMESIHLLEKAMQKKGLERGIVIRMHQESLFDEENIPHSILILDHFESTIENWLAQ